MDIYYFKADWCGPCQYFGPMVEEVAQDYPEMRIIKMDMDQPDAQLEGMKKNITSIPALVGCDSRIVGATNETKLREWFTQQREVYNSQLVCR